MLLVALAGCDRVFGLGDPYEDASTTVGSDAEVFDGPRPTGDAPPHGDAVDVPLIAHFSFDADFNDDSHTYAAATIGNGIALTAGHSGNALTLAGAGCLKISIDTPNAFTFAFWAKPADTGGGALLERQVTSGSSANHAYFVYATVGGGFAFAMWDGAQENSSSVSAAFVPGTYRHYAVSFDGSTKHQYVDGLEMMPPQAVNPIVYGPNQFEYIGCDGGFETFFNGQIDELYLYGGALDAAQIAQLAM